MTGSHIDTVRTGGRYDGNLGVLAGLEVVETLKQAGIEPARPLAVAFFTDEEGARFAPDMLGSLVYVGGMPLEEALDIGRIDGARLGDELDRIGYAGPLPCPGLTPHAFVELHIEQGPVLEAEGITIGAVTGVQGISWQELTITGQSNHAGTTPMAHAPRRGLRRRRAGRRRAPDGAGHRRPPGGHRRAARTSTPTSSTSSPRRPRFTVDLRNTDEAVLQEAERRLAERLDRAGRGRGRHRRPRPSWPGSSRSSSTEGDRPGRGAPPERLGHSVRRMPTGAGHDAQMLARVCPTGDGVRAQPWRHQPQPGRAHRSGRPGRRRRRPAPRPARPGRRALDGGPAEVRP